MFTSEEAAAVREAVRAWIGAETATEAIVARSIALTGIAAAVDVAPARRRITFSALRCVSSARTAGAEEWLVLWSDFCGELSSWIEHDGDAERRAALQRSVTL